jgi:hypothetical protein
MMDRQVSKHEVPSYEIVEEKIREIDGSIIIFRIFYLFMQIAYKFQLIKNDSLCTIEIPRNLLEGIKSGNEALLRELDDLLDKGIQEADCWNKVA